MTLPNGPDTSGFLRTLRILKFIFRPLDYLDNYARQYGDIFKLGGDDSPPFIYVSNPQVIKEIFTADPELFESGRGNRILRYLLGDNSLILLDGEPHQRQRRLLMPPFHGDRLREYSQLICDITEKVTNQWTVGKPFVVRTYTQEITLRVILQAVFGLHSGERYEQLRQLLHTLLESFGTPLSSSMLFFPWLRKDWGSLSPWGRFLQIKQQIKKVIFDEIRERREDADDSRTDILSLLIGARDEAGESMTDEELHDELMGLLIAGHETTASALVWALYWVYYLPEVHEKLRHELEIVGKKADPMEISRLPYLTAVCQETLRIYPVVPSTFVRILKAPMEIGGYQFEAGTGLLPSTYLVHQRQDIYPEPKRFKPERFLERQYSPYEYLPFGGSNRRCIGSALALLEMKLSLATIVSRFELALTNNRPIKPVRRGLTIAPPSNLRMVATQLRT
ncbi:MULTISPECIES: cytochrome P450 [unclassified Coleofasciculus]|uniref:cytochrome P450 n=1 Tax=unclassified Coleofasciculus TaxID=2692782 RepID=UPI00188301FD|nr:MULTISPECIES: cytochrome P450 [unclassified Coleofasciculus]MBE9127305.1 cytochrome P450 [Coleofasciculus sp. LEGE 07081]MBE9150806.1 cytochrome P450 [Coleofasciculus sp. LEGE 07092]